MYTKIYYYYILSYDNYSEIAAFWKRNKPTFSDFTWDMPTKSKSLPVLLIT